jgi:quinohemoprotein ethanol dehydrogenase
MMSGYRRGAWVATAVAGAALVMPQLVAKAPQLSPAVGLLDGNEGDDWPGYGRTFGEQHYSPHGDINVGNVGKLGLAWSYDLPAGNSMSGPIAVGGVLYTATGYSVVRAFDATSGKLLWTFDPKAPEASGRKLREGWGIRGLAWWNGKIYVGTQDGRLIAVNAKTGAEVWSAMTVGKDDYRFISGPPRVFDGKVIIGHGGADAADTRGYVTTYDAETGKMLWRFWTVPGNPAVDKDETTRIAAKSWAGEWWKHGGGGTAWNTFTYDPDTDTIMIGTGNGAPWNHKLRSDGQGDNLFLCSIVALDAKTGKYKWHYQFNPGETWDYNADMDMQLADLTIDGKLRKVVMEAPKNGFVYIIDRTNGQLISADKVAHVTWASEIDMKTGRPVENPKARFPDDEPFDLFPGPMGAHTWVPSAYSPKTRLLYLPVTEFGARYDTKGFKPGWRRPPDNSLNGGYNLSTDIEGVEGAPTPGSLLMAWDPVARKPAWRVSTGGGWNGGVLATGGGLVFQGRADGKFQAYDAANGKLLWHFDAKSPVLGPPITYRVKGRQYVTVLSGIGTSAGLLGKLAAMRSDYRTQARRVLTFELGAGKPLPPTEPYKVVIADDPDFKADKASYERGWASFGKNCFICHGINGLGGGTAPDLRGSVIKLDAGAFEQVVRQGALVPNGMPRFEEMTDQQLTDMRQYLRTVAQDMKD